MKEWLRLKIIKKLGGFIDANDAINAISDSKEKHKILTRGVKKLFNTIGPEDILKEHPDGTWTIEGRPISNGEKQQLIAEAHQFLGMRLWKVLQLDVKYQANKKMFILAENEMQIATGKFWLYTLDTLKTRLDSMKGGSGSFNSKSKGN